MVSFFGLKLGGEKKKKLTKDLKISVPPPPQDLGEANAGNGDFPESNSGPSSHETGVPSLSRQEIVESPVSSSRKNSPKELQIAPVSANKLGSSMIDLSKPSSGLRHHASNPGFGTRWHTGSLRSPGFAASGYPQTARPSTSDGERKIRPGKLDMQFPREATIEEFRSPLSPPATARNEDQLGTPFGEIPKSPLGQYELKLDLPSDVSTFTDFGAFKPSDAPAPLRIRKQASTRVSRVASRRYKPSQKSPTPPHSGEDREILETTILEGRPPKPHAQGSFPAAFQELENAISNLGPSTLPSRSCSLPASQRKLYTVPRSLSRATRKGSARPIIQNVCAKRDTLTINTQRRRSLQMKIEAAENASLPSPAITERTKTTGSGRTFERPPPLNLSLSSNLSGPERDGPRSAPFLLNPPRLFASASLMKSPLEIVGSQDYAKNSFFNEDDELCSNLDSPTRSSIYTDDEDEDEDEHDDDDHSMIDRPLSPESTSPVIPLTGPLASPCFPPLSQSPQGYFPALDELPPAAIPPIPPRSHRRGPPSPFVATFGADALMPVSPGPTAPLRPFGPQRAATTTGASLTAGWKRPQTAAATSASESNGSVQDGGLKPPPMPLRTRTEFKRPASRVR